MYGVDADMYYDFVEDLEEEYAKETIAETSFEMLDNGIFEGEKTKILPIVAASSGIIMGYNYHFTLNPLELVGRTPYEGD
jgi:hypothetical protein